MTMQIKDILEDIVLRRPELRRKVRESESFVVWEEVLLEDITKNAKPSKIREGILFVETSSSSWATELNFLKKDIIGKVNERLGEKVIKDIYFRVSGSRDIKVKQGGNI